MSPCHSPGGPWYPEMILRRCRTLTNQRYEPTTLSRMPPKRVATRDWILTVVPLGPLAAVVAAFGQVRLFGLQNVLLDPHRRSRLRQSVPVFDVARYLEVR